MKKLSLALATAVLFVGQSHASIVLEFFQGTSVNDTTLSLTPFPNNTVTLVPGGSRVFVQVAMHETAPTTLLDASNGGLDPSAVQGVFGSNQPGNWVVPATTPGGSGTLPACDTPYSYVFRAYLTGPNGSMGGGNET